MNPNADGVIVFDLDGTLIDIRARYLQLHGELCSELGKPSISAALYWSRKRRGMRAPEMFTDWAVDERDLYARRWIEEIERPGLLSLDKLLTGAMRVVTHLDPRRIVLATLRRDPSSARRQIADLGLSHMFSQVLIAGPDTRSKVDLVGRLTPHVTIDVVVGDTEEDIATARHFGAVAIAVESGLRNRTYLRARQPDATIESVTRLSVVAPFRELMRAGAHTFARAAETPLAQVSSQR